MTLSYFPMANLGSYDCLAAFIDTTIMILDKTALTTLASRASLAISYYSSFGSQIIGDKAYVAFHHSGTNNFNTYYFNADLCVTRTSSIC